MGMGEGVKLFFFVVVVVVVLSLMKGVHIIEKEQTRKLGRGQVRERNKRMGGKK
jgi:hypothetical protein